MTTQFPNHQEDELQSLRDHLSEAAQVALLHNAIVETTAEAIVTFDREGRVTSWNPAAVALFGYSKEDAIGSPVEFLLPGERGGGTHRRARGTFDRALAGETAREEATRLAKDGTMIAVTVMATQLRTADGTILGVVKLFRDIRARLATERALRESEARLQSFIDTAAIGLVRFTRDLRYTSCNNAYAVLMGRPADEIVGRRLDEVADPHRIEAVTPYLKRVLNGERVEFEVELPVPGPAGGRWQHVIYTPDRDNDGGVVGIVGSIVDITAQKRTESELRAARDTFRHLVDHSPFGIYAVDADFRIVQVSEGAAKVFETVQPVLGRDLADVLRVLWPEPFASEAIGHFRRVLSTGEPYHAPGTIERRRDIAKTEAYDWKVERLTLPDGRLGVVCHFYDLSEHQRYEEQIRLLMLEVTHRSKNLMTITQAIARQTASSTPENFIDRFSERLQALASNHDLLVESSWTGVQLRDLVEAQLAHFKELIGTRIVLSGPELRLTAAAAQALGLALHELSANAAKHGALSGQSGSIDISWQVQGGQFAIGWVELGGPAVNEPERRGFGTTVLTSLVGSSVDGEAALDYLPTGIQWRLSCPVGSLTG